jgi:integrase
MGKSTPFLYQKRGIFYLQKRVPKKLVPKVGRAFVRVSLRTKDRATAIQTAGSILGALDKEWHAALFAIPDDIQVTGFLSAQQTNEPALSDAAAAYIQSKGKTDSLKFTKPTELVIGTIIKQSGNKLISAYTRADAIRFRDSLIDRGVSQATVKRNLSIVRSIWNFAAREHGIDKANPFANMNISHAAKPVKRLPIPLPCIKTVQEQCRIIDDDIRWLVALISDTGMRLSEAAGLTIVDIDLDAQIPYLSLTERPWRPLKTTGSTRCIPLIGESLWAAEQAVSKAHNQFLFPRYCDEKRCKADYASNALNKWLRQHVPAGCVIHSFRHSMRDRLRAVQCPSDIIDQIGGWQTAGVGQSYGQGYGLDVLNEWMRKL